MGSLSKNFNLNEKVYKINEDNLKSAILRAYSNNKYRFYLNSELIDIDNRFRIFKFNGKVLIVKQSSEKNAKKEVFLAKNAMNKIDDLKVTNYTINVVEPRLITIDDIYYIITEYKGNSIQECLYSPGLKNDLTVDDLFEILELLISNGILYRGFLPRNTVVTKDHIYLFDWEDTEFIDNPLNRYMNTLWKTNFLLNWGYLYNIDVLISKLKKFESKKLREAPLTKYEICFKEWTNFSGTNIKLRNIILETVLFCERRVFIECNDFYIMPNDLAHLISDLFNVDIDVIFDITCYVLRKKSEKLYTEIVFKLSNVIVDYYINNGDIKKFVCYELLKILDLSVFINNCSENIYNLNFDNYNSDLLLLYKGDNYEMFKNFFFTILHKVISIYNQEKIIINDEMLARYLWSFKKGD